MRTEEVRDYIEDLEKNNEWKELTKINNVIQNSMNSLLEKGFIGYRIEIDDGKTIYSNSQKTGFKKIVNYMIKEYDLIDEIDIPYVSETNDYPACLINYEEKFRDESSMNNPVELIDGYYLETGAGKDYKRDRISELAEEIGLKLDFEGHWRN